MCWIPLVLYQNHLAFMGSWIQNVFSWVFRGFGIFSHGYFIGPKFFLIGISWVQNFSVRYSEGPKCFLLGISWVENIFSWLFCASEFILLWVICRFKSFSLGYFVGSIFFPVAISWIKNFFSWVFRKSKFYFVDISWVICEHIGEK